jgi:hypothetical protein
MYSDAMSDAEVDAVLWPHGWPELPRMHGNAALAGERALDLHDRFIGIVAQRYAPNDEVLADDLAQAARIKLWVMDPSRYGPRDREYLQDVIVQTARNARRSEFRAAFGLRREEVQENDEQAELALGTSDNAGVSRVDEAPGTLAECMDVLRLRRAA